MFKDLETEYILDKLETYDRALKDWKDIVGLQDKTLIDMMSERESWISYYTSLKIEINKMLDYIESKKKRLLAGRVEHLIKTLTIRMNDTTLNNLARQDNEYVEWELLSYEVRERYNIASAACDQLSQISYSITNYIKIKELGLERSRLDNN